MVDGTGGYPTCSVWDALVKAQQQQPEVPLGAILATVSSDALGVTLEYTAAQIADIMSARHFVEVRRTLGGPAPDETARALQQSRAALDRDRTWLDRTRDALAAADARLRRRSEAL